MEVQAFDDRGVGEHEQVEFGVGFAATTGSTTARRPCRPADGVACRRAGSGRHVEDLEDAGADVAAGWVCAPARSRWNSARMVGMTSPPVVGLV